MSCGLLTSEGWGKVDFLDLAGKFQTSGVDNWNRREGPNSLSPVNIHVHPCTARTQSIIDNVVLTTAHSSDSIGWCKKLHHHQVTEVRVLYCCNNKVQMFHKVIFHASRYKLQFRRREWLVCWKSTSLKSFPPWRLLKTPTGQSGGVCLHPRHPYVHATAGDNTKSVSLSNYVVDVADAE